MRKANARGHNLVVCVETATPIPRVQTNMTLLEGYGGPARLLRAWHLDGSPVTTLVKQSGSKRMPMSTCGQPITIPQGDAVFFGEPAIVIRNTSRAA
jgi:hypothetical protein